MKQFFGHKYVNTKATEEGIQGLLRRLIQALQVVVCMNHVRWFISIHKISVDNIDDCTIPNCVKTRE